MNSDEEKALFEEWGWQYDYIKREWIAPDGAKLTQDELVRVTLDYGKNSEYSLRQVIAQHGVKNPQQR